MVLDARISIKVGGKVGTRRKKPKHQECLKEEKRPDLKSKF
jgi:hypothetical protein